MDTGSLPIRYLGVPLVRTQITTSHCQPLLDNILSRLKTWTFRYLSYAGRLQLLKSVIFGIHNYWTLIFPLLKEALNESRNTVEPSYGHDP